MKILEIEVLEVTDNVRFKIITQSERCFEFTGSNGYRLESFAFPEIDSYANILFLRGSSEESDNLELVCKRDKFCEFALAIEEYNND